MEYFLLMAAMFGQLVLGESGSEPPWIEVEVPLSVEWTVADENGTAVQLPFTTELLFETWQQYDLKEATGRTELTRSIVSSLRTGGSLCRWNDNFYVALGESSLSNLNVLVDFKVSKVSALSALHELAARINCAPLWGEKVSAGFAYKAGVNGYPRDIKDIYEPVISLELKQVTAREVLFRLMKELPFDSFYRYQNYINNYGEVPLLRSRITIIVADARNRPKYLNVADSPDPAFSYSMSMEPHPDCGEVEVVAVGGGDVECFSFGKTEGKAIKSVDWAEPRD